MTKVLLSFLLVGFVSLVSSCGTGAEQANSKSPSPVQGGTKQQVISAAARDYSNTLITNDGEVYKSVKIKEITPAGIKITHSSGISGIPYEKLPKELQNELGGFNSKKAKKHRKKIADQQAKIADAYTARQIENEYLKSERDAKLLAASKNRKFTSYKAPPIVWGSTASSNSSRAWQVAQQRVKMIEQERMIETIRRAGDALKVDNGDLDRRLKRMELDNQLREQDELARQLHDSLKNQ